MPYQNTSSGVCFYVCVCACAVYKMDISKSYSNDPFLHVIRMLSDAATNKKPKNSTILTYNFENYNIPFYNFRNDIFKFVKISKPTDVFSSILADLNNENHFCLAQIIYQLQRQQQSTSVVGSPPHQFETFQCTRDCKCVLQFELNSYHHPYMNVSISEPFESVVKMHTNLQYYALFAYIACTILHRRISIFQFEVRELPLSSNNYINAISTEDKVLIEKILLTENFNFPTIRVKKFISNVKDLTNADIEIYG